MNFVQGRKNGYRWLSPGLEQLPSPWNGPFWLVFAVPRLQNESALLQNN